MAASRRAACAALLTFCLVNGALSCHYFHRSWGTMLPSVSHVIYRKGARLLMGDAGSKVKRVHLGLRKAQQPLSATMGPTVQLLDFKRAARQAMSGGGAGAKGATAREAYLSMCLVTRDENADIREWVDYHIGLGAGKFYVFDDNSKLPAIHSLIDLVDAGIVDYERMTDTPTTRRLQLHVYDTCIERYQHKHQWMAFVDTDELFVIRDPSVATLPDLLRQYENYGGLAVNWQMYGSSGHLERPGNSTLAAYTACYPHDHLENHHIKTIANLAFVESAGGDPHHFTYKAGKHAVDTAGVRVDGAKSQRVASERLVLNHYVTKSLEQFRGKMARGSAMGNRKTMEFFDLVQREATQTCTYALHLGQR